MIKMAIFDIDGTIYHSETKSISERVLQSLKQLREKGILVTIATGRTYSKITRTLEGYYDYIVAANGHVLIDNQNRVLEKHEMSQEETTDLIDFCAQRELALVLKFDDGCYMNKHYGKFWIFNGDSDLFEDYFVLDPLSKKEGLPHSAFIQLEKEDLEVFQMKNSHLRLVEIGGNCYDIYYSRLNKSVTLNLLLNKLGLQWRECFAIGDGRNDVEMIQNAELGIAMGNAAEELKGIAKDVTRNCAEDGVYWALKKYQLID